jgi:hypothetical protein
MKKLIITLIALIYSSCFFVIQTYGQEHETHEENEHNEEHEVGPYLVRLMAGYSVVPENQGKGVIPSLGLDLQRFLNHQLYVGIFTDIELTEYTIDRDTDDLIREYAFVATFVVGYDISKNFTVFAGPGYEFETHENFFVFRTGVEFMKEINEEWTVSIPVFYDYKEVYNAVSIGLAVAKKF